MAAIPKYKPSAEHRYFLHDPEGDGLLFFATEKDRDYAARECISEYVDCGGEYVDSDGWSESVTDVFVGTVTGLSQAINLQKRPPDDELDEDGYDEEGTDWSHGYEEICSYAVLPLGGSLQAQLAHTLEALQAVADVMVELPPSPYVDTMGMFIRNGLRGLPLYDDDHDSAGSLQ